MKTKREKKLLILPLIFLASSIILVSAQDFFQDVIQKSEFYQTIRPYIIPEVGDYTITPFQISELTLAIIGIISLIILFTVVYDIFMLIPVFSRVTMRIIAIGLGIIMVLFKWNVFLASFLFTWGIVVFGWAGSIAVFLVIILGIVILIGLFTGGNWFIDYLNRIRTTRETAESVNKARRAGGRIKALEEEARAAEK